MKSRPSLKSKYLKPLDWLVCCISQVSFALLCHSPRHNKSTENKLFSQCYQCFSWWRLVSVAVQDSSEISPSLGFSNKQTTDINSIGGEALSWWKHKYVQISAISEKQRQTPHLCPCRQGSSAIRESIVAMHPLISVCCLILSVNVCPLSRFLFSNHPQL